MRKLINTREFTKLAQQVGLVRSPSDDYQGSKGYRTINEHSLIRFIPSNNRLLMMRRWFSLAFYHEEPIEKAYNEVESKYFDYDVQKEKEITIEYLKEMVEKVDEFTKLVRPYAEEYWVKELKYKSLEEIG